jgi:putative restriction endonuclease
VATFGHLEGYPPGTMFDSRASLSAAGVHTPRQAGISGAQNVGAASIVLSGGYEDDEDHGTYLIYTGAGGRDPKTGGQTSDQVLTRTNLALVKNHLEGLPVRVIRGAQSGSAYAPPHGYRYDGLYYVQAYWRERGLSKHHVWRFRLEQKQDDPRAPVFQSSSWEAPQRTLIFQQRTVRSTAMARRVKEIHHYRCQVCGLALQTRAGFYAESAHIRPLGRPHDGPDSLGNILCLCPNHHVMFDTGAFCLRDDLSLINLGGKLRTAPQHRLALEHVRYHREHFGVLV